MAYSDYGRMPWEVAQADNGPVQPVVARQAGMTKEVLQKLLNCKSIGYYPDPITGLFSVCIEGRKIWGGLVTDAYFVQGIPDTVFVE